MVWILPLIFISRSLFSTPLGAVQRKPTTIGFNINFMFHKLFSFLVRFRYSSIFSLSFNEMLIVKYYISTEEFDNRKLLEKQRKQIGNKDYTVGWGSRIH